MPLASHEDTPEALVREVEAISWAFDKDDPRRRAVHNIASRLRRLLGLEQQGVTKVPLSPPPLTR